MKAMRDRGPQRLPTAVAVCALMGLLACGYSKHEPDRRPAVARLRLLDVFYDVSRFGDPQLGGRRRVVSAIIARRRAGWEVHPENYFSPYYKGALPDEAAYDIVELASVPDGDLKQLTSYVASEPGCCEDAASCVVVADFLGPMGPLVVLKNGDDYLLGGNVPPARDPVRRAVESCFPLPR